MKMVQVKIVYAGRGLLLFPAKQKLASLCIPQSYGFLEIEERCSNYCFSRGFEFLYCEVLRDEFI